MTILLHSSKTMVPTPIKNRALTTPVLLPKATQLAKYIHTLSPEQLQETMHVSPKLARTVSTIYKTWLSPQTDATAAVETFRGDIYSGLRSIEFSPAEQDFADSHLRILSGLYGVLRPYDAVKPYRLEAGYKMPDPRYHDLYSFWGESIAAHITDSTIINVTSGEYEKLVFPHLAGRRIIKPQFLTLDQHNQPVFVVVHAKIARGAYARWLIQRGDASANDLQEFSDLGYVFDPARSTPDEPVYICKEFLGLGLSQRLR